MWILKDYSTCSFYISATVFFHCLPIIHLLKNILEWNFSYLHAFLTPTFISYQVSPILPLHYFFSSLDSLCYYPSPGLIYVTSHILGWQRGWEKREACPIHGTELRNQRSHLLLRVEVIAGIMSMQTFWNIFCININVFQFHLPWTSCSTHIYHSRAASSWSWGKLLLKVRH